MHAVTDGQGRFCAFMHTSAQVHDVIGDRAVLASVPPMRKLIGATAYAANNLPAFAQRQGTEVVRSPMPRRLALPPFDPVADKQRIIFERSFCTLNDWRAIATYCDRTARDFMGGARLAVAVFRWLHSVRGLAETL